MHATNVQLLTQTLGTPWVQGAYDDPHPLIHPLATHQGHLRGLLRWPGAAEGAYVPVVEQRPSGVLLLATSSAHWLKLFFAEQELAGELDHALASQSGLYEPGDVGDSLPRFRLAHQLVSPGFFEQAAQSALDKGNTQQALITADRGARNVEGWARPHLVRAIIHHQVGRHAEARDAALACLEQPLWTLGESIQRATELAGWKEEADPERFRTLALDLERPPAERAAMWMDYHFVAGKTWASLRPLLADLYAEANAPAFSEWVLRPPR